MRKASWKILPSALALLLGACALFTSHYDSIRLENFTKLKAIHTKLFDDWTVGSDRAWNAAEAAGYCQSGDLSFRQAFEFAKSKDAKDNSGQKAVKLLWDEFSSNCKHLQSGPFSKVFSRELLSEIESNYDYAIRGELSRVGAPAQ